MSKEQKVNRATALIERNKKILSEISKLKTEYCHNHESVKNLFIKAQIDQQSVPDEYKKGTYGMDRFETW